MSTDVPDKGPLLIRIARAAIARTGGAALDTRDLPEWLRLPGAVFVTLTQNGQLRGCIGSLLAHRPLIDDLEDNARAAAYRDPRFPPLAPEELARTHVEVSILSRPEPMHFIDEDDALAQLLPDVDGVILEYGWHRATFLPQVWEQLPTPRQFMAHLKTKAGLAEDFWSDDIKLSRYSVEKFKEAS